MRVRLRRPALRDVSVLDLWASRPAIYHGEFNDLGMVIRSYRDEIVSGRIVSERAGLLMVEVVTTRKAIGTVTWQAVMYGPNPQSRAWNVGISLVPEARGQGLGGEAQRLLVEYLFTTTDANRVEASTDVENIPEQRALEKAGFHREGVARGAQYRAGGWHDMVIYARLRGDA